MTGLLQRIYSVLVYLVVSSFFPLFANSVDSGAPKKIVSCALVADELLLQILPSSTQRKRVLALSTFVDDPLYSNSTLEAKTVSARVGANIEQIVHLQPDLVIAASFNQTEFVSQLRHLKVKVHVMDGFQSIQDMKRHILDLGHLVSADTRAEEIVTQIDQRLAAFKKRLGSGKTFLILMPDLTVVGKETLWDDSLQKLGLRNLASERGIVGWQKVSEEWLLRISPDYVLSMGEQKDRASVLKSFGQSIALRKMKALQNEQVLLVPQALFSAFGPSFFDGWDLILGQIERQARPVDVSSDKR